MREIDRFEELYRDTYPNVQQYITRFLLHKHNSTTILPEDLIQCIYAVAWEKREVVWNLENPTGWLIECAKLTFKSMLREEKRWSVNMELVDDIMDSSDTQRQVEMKMLLEDEDFYLLKRHYGDGVPYQVLCEDLHIGKSALAMRLKRAKERFRELAEKE